MHVINKYYTYNIDIVNQSIDVSTSQSDIFERLEIPAIDCIYFLRPGAIFFVTLRTKLNES